MYRSNKTRFSIHLEACSEWSQLQELQKPWRETEGKKENWLNFISCLKHFFVSQKISCLDGLIEKTLSDLLIFFSHHFLHISRTLQVLSASTILCQKGPKQVFSSFCRFIARRTFVRVFLLLYFSSMLHSQDSRPVTRCPPMTSRSAEHRKQRRWGKTQKHTYAAFCWIPDSVLTFYSCHQTWRWRSESSSSWICFGRTNPKANDYCDPCSQ